MMAEAKQLRESCDCKKRCQSPDGMALSGGHADTIILLQVMLALAKASTVSLVVSRLVAQSTGLDPLNGTIGRGGFEAHMV